MSKAKNKTHISLTPNDDYVFDVILSNRLARTVNEPQCKLRACRFVSFNVIDSDRFNARTLQCGSRVSFFFPPSPPSPPCEVNFWRLFCGVFVCRRLVFEFFRCKALALVIECGYKCGSAIQGETRLKIDQSRSIPEISISMRVLCTGTQTLVQSVMDARGKTRTTERTQLCGKMSFRFVVKGVRAKWNSISIQLVFF